MCHVLQLGCVFYVVSCENLKEMYMYHEKFINMQDLEKKDRHVNMYCINCL